MYKAPISLIHPINNPNVRNAAAALAEVGLLREIITTVAYDPESHLAHFLKYLPTAIGNQLANELGRRTWIPPAGVPIQRHPWQEVWRILLSKSGLSRRVGLRRQDLVDWVYVSLDRHVARHHLNDLTAVYAYEDGAATTFEAAKQQGILCLYELPIAFYRMSHRILLEEAERFPHLALEIKTTKEPTWKLERKEREIQLADHIFVPSTVVQRSLLDAGVEPEKISIIPYGAPVDYFRPQTKTDDCFRALFVGLISPRKGVHYLLQAWQALKLADAELLLVGRNLLPMGWLEQYKETCCHIPSVPYSLLNKYYSMGSVLVLPSLVEGLALVQLEAMACGIPVITTPNAGGLDILTDGVEGFIIPIRDPEAIQQKLEWCYRHPQELADMGQAARRKAEQLSWRYYQQKLVNQVEKLLDLQK